VGRVHCERGVKKLINYAPNYLLNKTLAGLSKQKMAMNASYIKK
jgi:hypothetical protein